MFNIIRFAISTAKSKENGDKFILQTLKHYLFLLTNHIMATFSNPDLRFLRGLKLKGFSVVYANFS